MDKLSTWALLGLALAVVLALLKPKSTIQLGGRIVGMALDGDASMWAHLLSKTPGATIMAVANVVGATRDFQGALIPWPYLVQASIIDPVTGLAVATGSSPKAVGNPSVTTQYVVGSLAVPAAALGGKVYDVSVTLFADASDASGAATGVPAAIATLRHVNAIQVAPLTGPAVPSGSISVVDVAQAILRQGH